MKGPDLQQILLLVQANGFQVQGKPIGVQANHLLLQAKLLPTTPLIEKRYWATLVGFHFNFEIIII